MRLQNVSLDDLVPQRILFGFFPTYRKSPLRPQWDRIMQVLVAVVSDPAPRSDVNRLSFRDIGRLDMLEACSRRAHSALLLYSC
jgi:hypothetical protein